ncbi:MAG: hypothetical protein AAF211_13355 [Myxococcota bacterium]
MTKSTRNVTAKTTRTPVRELTRDEMAQVAGGGLLSSPIGFLRPRLPGIGGPVNPGPGTIVTP